MIQPFNPLLFLQVARQLASQSTGDAENRTAVSRAYYALFIIARDRVGITTRRDVHRTVIREVKMRHRSTGDQLDNLRRLRTTADYELIPNDPSQRNWVRNWQRAETIVNYILPRIQSI